MTEPDLDRPGKPLIARVQHDDGTWSPLEIEQTVRQNLQDLATACGDCEDVTREACEQAGLDWRDWGYFVVEMIEHDRWTREHMLAYETNYEAMHGEPAPGMAELRARMHKDKLGLTQLDPDRPTRNSSLPEVVFAPRSEMSGAARALREAVLRKLPNLLRRRCANTLPAVDGATRAARLVLRGRVVPELPCRLPADRGDEK
jgi:hypothetical protein